MILQKVGSMRIRSRLSDLIFSCSPENPPRLEVKNLIPIEKEFRLGEGCEILGFQNCAFDSKSNGIGRGTLLAGCIIVLSDTDS